MFYKKAGGADERAFIQDESIPLRAAIYAQGIIKMTANVVLVPQELGNFPATNSNLITTVSWPITGH